MKEKVPTTPHNRFGVERAQFLLVAMACQVLILTNVVASYYTGHNTEGAERGTRDHIHFVSIKRIEVCFHVVKLRHSLIGSWMASAEREDAELKES